MRRHARRQSFAAKQRAKRLVASWLRVARNLLAVELGCSDRPWFSLYLKED